MTGKPDTETHGDAVAAVYALAPAEREPAVATAATAITPPPVPPTEPGAAPAVAPRQLRVLHETRYAYDAPVELAHHLAHLRPRATPWQFVNECQLSITPQPDGEAMFDSIDSWGNWRTVFTHTRVHERLTVRAQSVVTISAPPLLTPTASLRWEDTAHGLRYRAGAVFDETVEFTLASVHVPLSPLLAAYARKVFRPGRPLLEAAIALMHTIHADFEYRPSSTSVATGAVDALKLRAGVCQDFAHVMIGCLRSLGLAGRYVSGYLLTQPPPGQPRLIGADASHAWAAVWCPMHGWVALDPTNAVVARQDHVTLAWGRDYADVAPLRGVIRGRGQAVPRVAVTVAPFDEVLPAGTLTPPSEARRS